MNKEELIGKVKGLGIECVVIGSGVMCVKGLRDSGDVDLIVREEVFERLSDEGWEMVVFEGDDRDVYLERNGVEVGLRWGGRGFYELMNGGFVVDGVWFCDLGFVRERKLERGRVKDLVDVSLIEKFMEGGA